jgi:hypothetical protein
MAETPLSAFATWMVSWGAVSLLVGLFIGTAIGVLGMNPAQYVLAEVCFTVSGVILLARVCWWLGFEQPDAKLSHLSIIGAVLFGVVGILWVVSIRWIEGLRWSCNLHLEFSGSMTADRKKTICREFEAVQSYLVRVGYTPITPIAPIQIGSNLPTTTTGSSGGILSDPRTPYGDSIIVNEKTVDSRDEMRGLYLNYFFQRLFDVSKHEFLKQPNRWLTSTLFPKYYANSYANKQYFNSAGWDSALWDMRNSFRPGFVDTLLFYVSKRLDEDWGKEGGLGQEGSDEFDKWFRGRIRLALSALDYSAVERIDKMLTDHGIKAAVAPPDASKAVH